MGKVIRAKFKCEFVTNYAHGSVVSLRPVTSGSAENNNFYTYTPGGEVKLEIVNSQTAAEFIPGKEYYVDFTLAE